MLIHSMLPRSTVNGPGARAIVWLQGCDLRCPGCFNPATHPFDRDRDKTVEEVAERIIACEGIEGATFSGGEPMQQALELLDLIRLLKRTRPELSVGMYSGYTEPELESGRFWTRYGIGQEARRLLWEDIKQHLDFAVLGRFVAARPSALPLRSSANQVLRLFGDRYREEHFKPLEFEVHIEAQGLVKITGFPLAGLPV